MMLDHRVWNLHRRVLEHIGKCQTLVHILWLVTFFIIYCPAHSIEYDETFKEVLHFMELMVFFWFLNLLYRLYKLPLNASTHI